MPGLLPSHQGPLKEGPGNMPPVVGVLTSSPPSVLALCSHFPEYFSRQVGPPCPDVPCFSQKDKTQKIKHLILQKTSKAVGFSNVLGLAKVVTIETLDQQSSAYAFKKKIVSIERRLFSSSHSTARREDSLNSGHCQPALMT